LRLRGGGEAGHEASRATTSYAGSARRSVWGRGGERWFPLRRHRTHNPARASSAAAVASMKTNVWGSNRVRGRIGKAHLKTTDVCLLSHRKRTVATSSHRMSEWTRCVWTLEAFGLAKRNRARSRMRPTHVQARRNCSRVRQGRRDSRTREPGNHVDTSAERRALLAPESRNLRCA